MANQLTMLIKRDRKARAKSSKVAKKEKIDSDAGVGIYVLFLVLWTIPTYYTRAKGGEVGHNLSLVFIKPLPLLLVGARYVMILAVFLHALANYDDGWCNREGTFFTRALMSGIGALYFARATAILQTKYRVLTDSNNKILSWLYPAYQVDIFMEMCFGAGVLLVNLWLVFIANDPVDMVLNSLAVEFIGNLDNELKKNLLDSVEYWDYSTDNEEGLMKQSYDCVGCEKPIWGERYRCAEETCDIDLCKQCHSEFAESGKHHTIGHSIKFIPRKKNSLTDAIICEFSKEPVLLKGLVDLLSTGSVKISFMVIVAAISLLLPAVCLTAVFYGPVCKA